MAQMDNNEDINVRRDCVLSCLRVYLNEDLETLVKEYLEVNPLGPEEPEDEVGQVLALKSPHYARDNNPRPNNTVKGFIGKRAAGTVSPVIRPS